MRAVWGDEVAQFVMDMLDEPRGFGLCQAQGFLDASGVLEAGIVYHNWSPKARTIEISAAARNHSWATRSRLRAIFGYAFDLADCQMVFARTSERNPIPLRIWRALGADEYRIPRFLGPDEAVIVTTLTAETWRASRFAR